MANGLTVLIPCKDEEHNIRACIESVRGLADEILVADSGSTDRTLDIVREMGGCRIIERTYVNAADFQNWAIPQATHPWVLLVDADERVTDQLAAEIRGVVGETPDMDAYCMLRQNYFLGRRINHCGWNTATVIRLFRRDVCRFRALQVHSSLEVPSGKVGRLRGKFLHYTCHDLHEYMARMNRYAAWSALDMHATGRRVGYAGLLLRPVLRFLQFYLVRGGLLDGMAGLAVCMTTGYYTFMKYAKLWDLSTSARAPQWAEDALRPSAEVAGGDGRPEAGERRKTAA